MNGSSLESTSDTKLKIYRQLGCIVGRRSLKCLIRKSLTLYRRSQLPIPAIQPKIQFRTIAIRRPRLAYSHAHVRLHPIVNRMPFPLIEHQRHITFNLLLLFIDGIARACVCLSN